MRCAADSDRRSKPVLASSQRVVSAAVSWLALAMRSLWPLFIFGALGLLVVSLVRVRVIVDEREIRVINMGMAAMTYGIEEVVGADVAEGGCILVDDHQRCSIPGLYAAGDVVIGLDQISHAMGEGGVAAVTIRNDLTQDNPLVRDAGKVRIVELADA